MDYRSPVDFYRQGPPPRQTSEDTMDYQKFMNMLYALLHVLWGEEWGQFSMYNPLKFEVSNVSLPAISYFLKKREIGVVGNDSRKELKPRERERMTTFNPQTNEEEVTIVYGQTHHLTVEFYIYGHNNKEAIELSEDFMNVLFEYKGLLMRKGLKNIWFQKEEDKGEGGKDRYSTRVLTYLVVLEHVFTANHGFIENTEVEIDTVFDRMAKDGLLPFDVEQEEDT